MSLLIGQSIDGKTLEKECSLWADSRFTSMCDALIPAMLGRENWQSFSATARVNVRDDGIDAEVTLDSPPSTPTPLIQGGWNVFQYKRRSVIAQDRRAALSRLRHKGTRGPVAAGSLFGAVQAIAEKKNRYPNQYIVCTNLDVTTAEKELLSEAILTGCPDDSRPRVQIVGAAELAALLNNFPHVRAAFFEPSLFKTWEAAHESHKQQAGDIPYVEHIVGRASEIKNLRNLLDDSSIRIITLTGPPGIGKTRLALDATKNVRPLVVVALDPRSMKTADTLALARSGEEEVICIVEDPERESFAALAREIVGQAGLKLIATLSLPSDAPRLSFGLDTRERHLRLDRLSNDDARVLLKGTGLEIRFEVKDWIISRAGGVPGILLAATRLKDGAPPDQLQLAVGEALAQNLSDRLGRQALRNMTLLSAMTHVGVSGIARSEVELLDRAFGDNKGVDEVLSSLETLEAAGWIKRSGAYVSVSVPLLANHLVSKLLGAKSEGSLDKAFLCFAKLSPQGRARFVARLAEAGGTAANRFWDALFDPTEPNAPLGNLEKAITNMHILRSAAAGAPDRTLRLIAHGLRNVATSDSLVLSIETQRELKWALEEPLFRRATSYETMRTLWSLADSENDDGSGDVADLIAECFHPRHPHMPLPLQQRLLLFEEWMTPPASEANRSRAIKVVTRGLLGGMTHLRESAGPEPFDGQPTITWPEYSAYIQGIADHLLTVGTEAGVIAETALAQAPRVIALLIEPSRPDLAAEAIPRFEKLVTTALAKPESQNPASLLATLARARRLVRETSEQDSQEASTTIALEKLANQLAEIEGRIISPSGRELPDSASLFLWKLRLWGGDWIADPDEDTSSDHEPRFVRELTALAAEAVANPAVFDAAAQRWAVTDQAHRAHVFFQFLGTLDTSQYFLDWIEAIGAKPEGVMPFTMYCFGWRARAREACEVRLDEMANNPGAPALAILRASVYLPDANRAFKRIASLITSGAVDADRAAEMIKVSHWLKNLTPTQLAELLRAIAGVRHEHATSAVGLIAVWLHLKQPLDQTLTDVGWALVEAANGSVRGVGDSDFDDLATTLTAEDPERGFALLESRLARKRSQGMAWDLSSLFTPWHFIDRLRDIDKTRVLRILLDAATDWLEGLELRWRLSRWLRQNEDCETLVELCSGNVERARVLAGCLRLGKGETEFWKIAFTLLEMFPNDEGLQSRLSSALSGDGEVIHGPASEVFAQLKKVVDDKLAATETPQAARNWLMDVRARLDDRVQAEIVWEYDIDVNGLTRYIEDKDSDQHLWAVGRVLKGGTMTDIQRLLSIDDIEESLPQVDLKPQRRKALESALEVWKRAR